MKLTYTIITFFLLMLITFSGYEAQTKWFKYAGNPVMLKGESGQWDDMGVTFQNVLWDGEKYNMWYGGENADSKSVGYATSTDGINWVKYENNPVLEAGAAWEWDGDGIIPTSVLFNGSQFMMYYDVHRHEVGIGLATSSDGINWVKDTLNNPVLVSGGSGKWDSAHVFHANVIFEDSIYKMWYCGDSRYQLASGTPLIYRIGYAESPDGVNWTKRSDPVLQEGDFETWANDLQTPFTIYENDTYTMWYNSVNTLDWSIWKINCAVSSDGIQWDIFEDNPVILQGEVGSWDVFKIWKPSVIKENNLYKMWYSGDQGNNACIGYAEDFSGFVHADSVILDKLYYAPNQEPLTIQGQVFNPENHSHSAIAIIMSDDGSVKDSVELKDDGLNGDLAAGDGIYSGPYPLTEEKTYTVAVKTVDLETGFTRVGYDWGITDKFTTRGPLEFQSIEFISEDPEPDAGTRAKFNITLHNFGNIDKVSNVDVNIIIPDSLKENGLVTNTTTGTPEWGDILPGESMTNSSRPYALSFHADCKDGLYLLGLEITSNGEPFWYDTFDITVDVEDEVSSFPDKFALEQNYPNPFNPATTIQYTIPVGSRQSSVGGTQYPESSIQNQVSVSLKVYDVLGRQVATLVNEHQTPGNYEVKLNASGLSSGVYFYKLNAGKFIDVKKMLLIR